MFKISCGGQKQGLKNGLVRSILVYQFSTGPNRGLDHFSLDWTTHWTYQNPKTKVSHTFLTVDLFLIPSFNDWLYP